MVDLAGSFQSYDRIYPFADAPDQYKEIVWWRVSEDVAPLPFPTPFCVRSWDEREQLEVPVVGTRYGPYPRYVGPLPPITTGNVCGTPEQWLNGLSYADYLAGKYHACDCPVHMPYVMTAAGGDVDGGLATIAASAQLDGLGGDVDAGLATFATDAEIVAEGGDVDAGIATIAASATITAAGGDVDAGIATIAAYRILDATGGDVDGGIATIVASATITASGGDVDAGIATGINTGSTGGKLPGTGANLAGGGIPLWANPGGITAVGGAAATVTFALATSPTGFLAGTNFGFTVPSAAGIKGIEGTWNVKTSGAVTFTKDFQVILTKAGATFGVNHASPTAWSTSFTNRTYGGASDDWGVAQTGADVNDSTWGVVMEVDASNATSRTISADSLKVNVFWSLPF